MSSIRRWRRGRHELSLIIKDGATIILYEGGNIALLQSYSLGGEDKARKDADAIARVGHLNFVGQGAESYAAAR